MTQKSLCKLFFHKAFVLRPSTLSKPCATQFLVKSFTTENASSPRVKRPLNPFFLFLQDQRNTTLIPKNEPTKFVKTSSEKWKVLSNDEKQIYLQQFQEMSDSYKIYKANLSKEDIESMRHQNAERRKIKKQRKIKRNHKTECMEAGMPKRPLTSFMAFVQISMTDSKSLEPIPTRIKNLALQWKDMSEASKQKYINITQKDQERYHEEMKTFAKKMKEEGKTHLVPAKYKKIIKTLN